MAGKTIRKQRRSISTPIPPGQHSLVERAKSFFEVDNLSREGGYLKPAKHLLVDLTESSISATDQSASDRSTIRTAGARPELPGKTLGSEFFAIASKPRTGNANPERHRQDARHVFEAGKYDGAYFVTTGQRILDSCADLEAKSGAVIRTPSEWLPIFREHEE